MDPRNFRPDLIDSLGIVDFALRREYGRDRGLNPLPSEAQIRALEKLNNKLQNKLKPSLKKAIINISSSSSALDNSNYDEIEINFDLKSTTRTRVILFEGKVLKKNYNSLVTGTSKRFAILLNDVLLITSEQSSSDWSLKSSEKLYLHQLIDLEHVGIKDLSKYTDQSATTASENPCTSVFEIMTPDQTLHLIAESETDKCIWLEELESAIFCIKSVQPWKNIGWQHEVIRGTIYSNTIYGDLEALKVSIGARLDMPGKSLDVPDNSGMSALHWACIFGQIEAVKLLLDHGAEIDMLNSGLNTPLMLAAAFARSDIFFLLIERGADIRMRNRMDLDCMLMSVMYGNVTIDLYDIINILQRKGVDINQQDPSGASPLQKCAACNIFRPIQALVDCGADVNMKHAKNGLTSLQIACSVPNPDPETVRSLLEKGAHPNWRDSNMKNAFDMVLDEHKNKLANATPSSPSKSRKQTVDEVQEFAQIALPVLMELVRKGCRISSESIATLRPSFQEVIKSGITTWEAAIAPETFIEFLSSLPDKQLSGSKELWINDSASSYCLLCMQKFTYSIRRHHCRTCGALVCDPCSNKRLFITAAAVIKANTNINNNISTNTSSKNTNIDNNSHTTSTTVCLEQPRKPSGGGGSYHSSTSPLQQNLPTITTTTTIQSNHHHQLGERICDGCFNKLSHECFLYQQAMAKIRKNEAKLAAANIELQKETELELKNKKDSMLFNNNILFTTSSTMKQTSTTAIGRAQFAATETRRALELRGEKLQQFAEKSEQMREGASEYKLLASKLAQQQRNALKKSWI